MHFQYTVSPSEPARAANANEPGSEATELLRQLLEVQREQLNLQKAAAQAHDMNARWRSYLNRWQQEFPELPDACKYALPILERSYGQLIADLAAHFREHGADALDGDFALGEFLDRYGMRLSQLGSILSLVAYIAEATSSTQAGESSSQ
ncbi:MAG: hypothetical protein JNM56_36140 [Planctomycetia bacterium]|nr:hypothetical protein [Planctomycetia bacterium]